MSVFKKGYSDENYDIQFTQELDDDGMLIRQQMDITSKYNGNEQYCKYLIERPKKEHRDEWLYHMTRVENIPEIKRVGLIPKVGNLYANHWLSFFNNDLIYEKLYPGVFLLSGKRIGKRGAEGYRTCKVNVNDLDPNLLFIDNAWKDEKSLFYIGAIPPKKLIIMR